MPVDALPVPHLLAAPMGLLPVGITPKTVTTGPWTLADGTIATGTATISCPVNAVHIPSGQPISSGDMKVKLVDGLASWDLCPTDQAGLNVTGWTYTLRVWLREATTELLPVTFLLPSSSPSPVDLDALTAVPTSTGTVSVDLDQTMTALLNDPTSATYARVIALINARTGFGAGTP